MRLYLSSFRLGEHADRLVELVGQNARVSVTMNALDAAPLELRERLFARMVADFAAVGLGVQELDLRAYFPSSARIETMLSECDLVWANGGNAFTLLMAMTQSGFTGAVTELLDVDAVAYGGYSAGAVVAGPTLRGMEIVDSTSPVSAIPPGYAAEIQWEGMGLIDYSIAPHFQSNHPESASIDLVVRYFAEHDMPCCPLRDGEAIVIDGESEQQLTLE